MLKDPLNSIYGLCASKDSLNKIYNPYILGTWYGYKILKTA
jgi:hypothetical protein